MTIARPLPPAPSVGDHSITLVLPPDLAFAAERACELYARIHMGQLGELASHLREGWRAAGISGELDAHILRMAAMCSDKAEAIDILLVAAHRIADACDRAIPCIDKTRQKILAEVTANLMRGIPPRTGALPEDFIGPSGSTEITITITIDGNHVSMAALKDNGGFLNAVTCPTFAQAVHAGREEVAYQRLLMNIYRMPGLTVRWAGK